MLSVYKIVIKEFNHRAG